MSFINRKERRGKQDKERKRARDDSEDEGEYRSTHRHRKPGGSQKSFRHEQGAHAEHERWAGPREHERFPEHRMYDFQRPPGFHRERDYPRGDKR